MAPRVGIVGIGHCRFGNSSDYDLVDVIAYAANAAFRDAGGLKLHGVGQLLGQIRQFDAIALEVEVTLFVDGHHHGRIQLIHGGRGVGLDHLGHHDGQGLGEAGHHHDEHDEQHQHDVDQGGKVNI